MRSIVTDRVAWSVDLSVCLSVTVVSPAKMAEQIEMPFELRSRVGPGNHVLVGGFRSPHGTRVGSRKHVLGRGAHWCHLANTIEPSMCGGDAACCQTTLTTCFFRIIRQTGLTFITCDCLRVVSVTELVPHFEQSDAAYIGYPGIKDAYEAFDLEISFKPEATDGHIPFTVSCFHPRCTVCCKTFGNEREHISYLV